MRKTIILLVVSSLVFCFASCKKCEGNKCSHPNCTCGEACLGDSCQCGEEIKGKPGVKVKNALIYLDNSSSMKGYTEDMTYINSITQLWKAYPNTKVLKCGESYKPLDEAKGSVVDQLKKLAYGGASLLQEDLKEIVGKLNDTDIAFYITDGILSGKSTDIDNDRKWTLKNAANLKLDIKSVFNKAKDKGIGVSIYQFPANFKGVYYCYNNRDNVNINSQRMFYVFAIGKPEILVDFKTQFVGTEYFNPKNQLHFIDPLPIASDIYSTDAPGGHFSLESVLKKQVNPGKIEISLKAAPLINNFVADDSKENTTKAFSSMAQKFVVTANGKRVEEPNFSVNYDEGSRIFKFLITPQLYGKQIEVTVSAPYELPAWVKLSNYFDDNDGDRYMMKGNGRDSKTFMLLHLIDGIKQGLLGDGGTMYEARTIFSEK